MSIELDYKLLGKRIKSRRTEAKLTQEQLASTVDVATSNISHIERATTQVSLPTLVKIANALGVSLDQLVCDSLPVSGVYLRQDFEGLLSDCSVEETQIIKDIVIATKKTLRELSLLWHLVDVCDEHRYTGVQLNNLSADNFKVRIFGFHICVKLVGFAG